MKKIILILAVLSLATAISAQKKPKAPAAPKKAEVATPVAAPAATRPAVNPAAKSDAAFNLIAWGGYNLTLKNSDQTADTTSTFGGIAGGIKAFYGSDLQFGLGVSYVTYQKVPDVSVFDVTVPGYTVYLIPIEARVRYFVMPGAYLGAVAGYNIYNVSVGSATEAPTLIGLGGTVGYAYAVTDTISVDVSADVKYLLSTDSLKSKGNLTITPGVGVSFKF